MQSARRRSTRIEPVTVVRHALIRTPISPVVAMERASFTDVLVDAVNAPKPVGSSPNRYREATFRTGTGKVDAEPSGGNESAANNSTRSIAPLSLTNKNATDLYTQLDTLLREKSLLIAVA